MDIERLITRANISSPEKEPRFYNPKTGEEGYWSPDLSARLRKEALSGWRYILRLPDKSLFWIVTIDGPDHGVTSYGPFTKDVLQQ